MFVPISRPANCRTRIKNLDVDIRFILFFTCVVDRKKPNKQTENEKKKTKKYFSKNSTDIENDRRIKKKSERLSRCTVIRSQTFNPSVQSRPVFT